MLTLTGMLLDGTKIEGKDCVVLTTPGRGRPWSMDGAAERKRQGRKVVDPGPQAPVDTLKPRR